MTLVASDPVPHVNISWFPSATRLTAYTRSLCTTRATCFRLNVRKALSFNFRTEVVFTHLESRSRRPVSPALLSNDLALLYHRGWILAHFRPNLSCEACEALPLVPDW